MNSDIINPWVINTEKITYKEIVQVYVPSTTTNEITANSGISTSTINITNPVNSSLVKLNNDSIESYTLTMPEKCTADKYPAIIYKDNTDKLKWVKHGDFAQDKIIVNNGAQSFQDTGVLVNYNDNSLNKYGGLIRRQSNGHYYIVDEEVSPTGLTFNQVGNLHVDTITANTINSINVNSFDSVNVKDSTIVMAEGNTDDINNIGILMQHSQTKYSGIIKEKASGSFKLVDLSALPSLTATFVSSQYASLYLKNLVNYGYVRFHSSNGFYTEVKTSADQLSNISFVFPPTSGINGQFLMTNGTGQLSWGTVNLSTINASITNLNNSVNANIASINTLNNKVNANTSNIDSIGTQLSSTNVTVDNNESTLNSLRMQVGYMFNGTPLTERVSGIDSRITTINTILDNAAIVFNNTDNTINDLRTQIGTNTNFITSLTSRVNGVDSNIVDINGNLGYLNTMVDNARTRISTLESTSDVHTGEILALTDRTSVVESNIAGIDGNLRYANNTLYDVANQVTTLENTSGGHTTSINTLNTNVANHTTSINTLNTTIADHTTSIDTLNTNITNTTSYTSDLGMQLTGVNDRLSTTENTASYCVTSILYDSSRIDTIDDRITTNTIKIGTLPSNSASNSICINATANQINPSNSGFYAAPVRTNSSTNEGAYMLMRTNNNEIISNPYVVMNNGSTNETNIYTNNAPFCVKKDDSNGIQLRIIGSTNNNQQLMLGYDTINNKGNIQSVLWGSAHMPLSINSSGGNVTIGSADSTTTIGGSLSSTGAISGSSLTTTGATSTGSLTVNSTSIRLGSGAGTTSQGANAIAIGSNAGNASQGTNSIMIGASAGAASSAANSICLNASGSALNPTNANSFYVSPVRSNSSTTEGAYMLMRTNNNEVVSNPYVVMNNGSTNETIGLYNDTPLCIKRDSAVIGKHLKISGSTDPARQLLIGYDTTNNRGTIQAIHQGSTYTNLLLNADGGNVCVGTTSDSGYKLNVNGTIGATGLILNNTAIRLGTYAGNFVQQTNTVAIGPSAGQSYQSRYAIAIGTNTGNSSQSQNCIAIGQNAGQNSQGTNGIAIGVSAGDLSQGANAIAIGANAGTSNQTANSIILNATGNVLNNSAAGLFVDPIRNVTSSNNTLVCYNSTTKEVAYNSTLYSNLLAALLRTPQMILNCSFTAGTTVNVYSVLKIYTSQIDFQHSSLTFTGVNSGSDSLNVYNGAKTSFTSQNVPYQTQLYIPFNGTLIYEIKPFWCGSGNGLHGCRVSRASTVIYHKKQQTSNNGGCEYPIGKQVIPNLQANDVVEFLVTENNGRNLSFDDIQNHIDLQIPGGLSLYMIPASI